MINKNRGREALRRCFIYHQRARSRAAECSAKGAWGAAGSVMLDFPQSARTAETIAVRALCMCVCVGGYGWSILGIVLGSGEEVERDGAFLLGRSGCGLIGGGCFAVGTGGEGIGFVVGLTHGG